MDRESAIDYTATIIDENGEVILESPGPIDMESNDILVGWQCGFEPLFIAVRGDSLDGMDAEDIAREHLIARNWFANGDDREADYILES